MRLALKFRAKAKQAKQFQVKLRQVHQVILAGMETGMGQNIGNACLKKKKRKVNGKATLFYGDLMGHSFGFIWMCLKMDDNGYSPAKLPLDKAICQNWLTDLADLEGSQ